MNYIETCTKKLFRKLLEPVFFQVSFQIVTSDKRIPSLQHCTPVGGKDPPSHSPFHRFTVGNMAQLMGGIKQELAGSFPHHGILKEITFFQNHRFLQEKVKQTEKPGITGFL